MKTLLHSYEAIERLARFFGWRFYEGCVTNSPRIVWNHGLHREFNPFVATDDAFLMVDEIIGKGYEFYLFYKSSENKNNITRLEWVSEIRDLKNKVIAWSMESDRNISICKTIDIFIDLYPEKADKSDLSSKINYSSENQRKNEII